MLTSVPTLFVVFTAVLVAVLAIAQQFGREFLQQLFHDTGRRSEGRRQRRAFEWSMGACLGCANYFWAVREMRGIIQPLTPALAENLILAQVGLVVLGSAFGALGIYQLKRAIDRAG